MEEAAMKRARRFACLVALMGVTATAAPAYDFTVVTHGFQLGTGQVPPWTLTMAKEILNQAGDASSCALGGSAVGSVFQYVPEDKLVGMTTLRTGTWEYVCGAVVPNGEIVLIFDWAQESDSPNQGGSNGYAEAAADVLYAALRDPEYELAAFSAQDPFAAMTHIHFIGHSRGTVVTSETVERLAVASETVDHLTSIDPHPVNGTLADEALIGLDWGDDVPQVWTGVTFADSYYREDGGSDPHSLDFDGMSLTNVDAQVKLDCGLDDLGIAMGGLDPDINPADQEHVKSHAWYHGTINRTLANDGAGIAIDPNADEDWYGRSCVPTCDQNGCDTGFAYSLIANDEPRPGPVGRETPGTGGSSPSAGFDPKTIYNGNFEIVNGVGVGHAGWRYQGGDKTGVAGFEPRFGNACNYWARLGPDDPVLTHNWQYIDGSVSAFSMHYRVFVPGVATLRVRLVDETGTEVIELGNEVVGAATGWQATTYTVPMAQRGGSYRLQLELDGVGTAHVDVDNLAYDSSPSGSQPPDGCVNVPSVSRPSLALLVAGLLAIGTCALTLGPSRS